MTDPTKDIDGLLGYLSGAADHSFTTIPSNIAADYYAALTALVAERDALRTELTNAKSFWRPLSERRDEADAAKQRVTELESHPPADRDRELRERLVCALIVPAFELYSASRSVDPARYAVSVADAAIAAMRKEGGGA